MAHLSGGGENNLQTPRMELQAHSSYEAITTPDFELFLERRKSEEIICPCT